MTVDAHLAQAEHEVRWTQKLLAFGLLMPLLVGYPMLAYLGLLDHVSWVVPLGASAVFGAVLGLRLRRNLRDLAILRGD